MADIVGMQEFWSPIFEVTIDENVSTPQATIDFTLPAGAVAIQVQQLIKIASTWDDVTAALLDVDAVNATLEFQGGGVGQVEGISDVGAWLVLGVNIDYNGNSKFYGDKNPLTVIEVLTGVLISRWNNVIITAGVAGEDLICRGVQMGVRIWYTQAIAGVTDWTGGEKEQIRQAVGITGTKSATAGGNLDDVLLDTGTTLPAQIVAHDADIKARFTGVEGATFVTGDDSLEAISDKVALEATLGTHDTDIKALIGTPSVDISADIAANLAAIQAIQNNTRFTAAVPNPMQKPDAGNSPYRHAANLYDTQGDMEDPDNSEILVRIIKNDGTFITANLYKENALSTALDNPTDTGTFPVASGWRAMEREALGKFFFFYKVASTETEEPLTVEFGWDEAGQVNYQSRSTKISDFVGDIENILLEVLAIGVKVDSGTPAPTIPAQITTHDTDIKGVIATHDTDIKALPRMEACPDLMYVPSGRTLINIEGGISDTDTEIPVLIATNLLTTGLIKIESEYIIYDGITDSKLQVTQRGAYSTTPVAHNNNVIVTQSVLFPIRLVIFDNAGNMKDADSAPTLEIEDWKETQELAPTAMTAISTGIYGYNYIIDYGEVPENKLFKFSATVDTKTRKLRHEVVIIDEPASSIELVQLVGGGIGMYPCTQAGWYDLDGILTEWNDGLEGIVEDADTGAPLFKAYVTAYLIENNVVLYNGRPPGQAKTRVNGTWLMFLDAETYQFVIEKDGFRIREDGTVERTVG